MQDKSVIFTTTGIQGFTLLELLIVLAISGILFGLASPSFTKLIQKHRADTLQSILRTAVYNTRSTAVSNKSITALCPHGTTACGDDWNQGFIIFTDKNNDRKIDPEDTLLEVKKFTKSNFNLSWRASGGRNFLRYSPSGMAREFGRFTLCNNNNDDTLARSMVINRNGRVRTYIDRDGDGVVEDIDGRTPDCT